MKYKCIQSFHDFQVQDNGNYLLVQYFKDNIYSNIQLGCSRYFKYYTIIDERKDKLNKLINEKIN
jgi:hypothetical protein